MTLHLHRAARSDALVAALAEVLEDPPQDPLTPEVVAVHSRGIERWLAQELSLRLGVGPLGSDGVLAGVEFPFPARLVQTALSGATGDDPHDDPWEPERLTWPVLATVEAHRDDPEVIGPLAHHLRDPQAGRRLGAVRHVADLFDRYAVHRPEMVRAWGAGDDVGADGRPLLPEHRWQARLWRQVADRLDDLGPAARLERGVEAIAAGAASTLPGRICVFGVTALPGSYLEVLDALAVHRDVHLLLLHPSPALWETVARAVPDGVPTRAADPTAGLASHPLLRSWARDARELQVVALAPGRAGRTHHPHTAGPSDDAPVLALLQRRIRDDAPVPPPGEDDTRPTLDPGDASLQLHSCHGRHRQVEVLRDALLHLMAADPSLEPRDVIVHCPDIEVFAPLVSAVFGADAVRPGIGTGGAPSLRVRMADRSLRRTNPVLETVDRILQLPDARVTTTEVLDLLVRAPVRRRLDLDDDRIGLLQQWVEELGIRWGLDEHHRAQEGLPGVAVGTWEAGLHRLHVGRAMADEHHRRPGGVVPFDDAEADPELAGRLAELVGLVRGVRDQLAGPHTLVQWASRIRAATDRLAEVTERDRWQRVQLDRVLDRVLTAAGRHADEVELELPEVRRLLDRELQGRPTRAGHRTGAVTFCTLVPMRSVPHRVVAVLGLDHEVFPRRPTSDADDLLAAAPRVGDRDPRSEDRQLLLDALMSAQDAFLLTWSGRDHRTNESRPPSVVVDELVDVVLRTVRTDRPALVTEHPLQSHDPRAFDAERPFSFDRRALEAARVAVGRRHDPPPFVVEPIAVAPEPTIDVADLERFLVDPVGTFVRETLGLSLAAGAEPRGDEIPTKMGPLDTWAVGEELVRAWFAGQDRDAVEEHLRARGHLPPGALATSDLDTARSRAARIAELGELRQVGPADVRGVDVDVELDDGRLVVGTVVDVDVAGRNVTTVTASTIKAKHRLRAWVRLLALTASDPELPERAQTLGRRGRKAVLVTTRLPGADPAQRRGFARRQLAALVALRDEGLRRPLPLPPDTAMRCAELLRDDGQLHGAGSEWTTGRFPGEDVAPAHRLVLGGTLTFDELLQRPVAAEDAVWCGGEESALLAWSRRLWREILPAERKCTK